MSAFHVFPLTKAKNGYLQFSGILELLSMFVHGNPYFVENNAFVKLESFWLVLRFILFLQAF